jgi:hypothetical protein
MSDSIRFLISQLEEHWINDIEPSKLFQSRRRHDYYKIKKNELLLSYMYQIYHV